MENLNKINVDDIIQGMTALTSNNNFYECYLAQLKRSGKDIDPIKKCIQETMEVLGDGIKSFVIYGEPQSGKTGMMIALTDRILDAGHKIVVILLNDSKRLLEQNLNRFEKSDIKPTPANAMTLYENGEKIEDVQYILFCKKNALNLNKLINMLGKNPVVVIDDEADYATPNGKINKGERSKINELVQKLIGNHNYYIGVTATPARLDLNNTLENDNEQWVQFKAHKDYIGKNEFFLEDGHYERFFVSNRQERDLEKAVIAFMCNAAVLNSLNQSKGKSEKNYCMLVHTSGRKSDHRTDKSIIDKLSRDILIRGSLRNTRYHNIFREHKDKHKILKQIPDALILKYLDENMSSNKVIEINSDNKQTHDMGNPPARFTFYVGGNIVSRGVTFNNLLSMYFTRDTKTIFQQDTFIQRARMFGARKEYLDFFQLWIPEELFMDWQRSFLYHYISLLDLSSTGTAPIWTTGGRVVPTAPGSIDKRNIFSTQRERVTKKFNYLPFKDKVERIKNNNSISTYNKLKEFERILPIKQDIKIILNIIDLLSAGNKANVDLLETRYPKINSEYHDTLFRPQGVLGGEDRKKIIRDHAVMFLVNNYNEARMLYYYGSQKIRFFQKRSE